MIQLYNDDYNNILPTLANNSIDLILTDLPYNITDNKWDKEVIDLDKLWEQYNRIIKDNGCIALFASSRFTPLLINSNYKNWKYNWYWQKKNSTAFLLAKKQPLRKIEEICIFYKKPPLYIPQMTSGKPNKGRLIKKSTSNYNLKPNFNSKPNITGDRYPTNVLEFNYDNKKYHPTQKPILLLEYIIKTYTNENETVLDNTMGSGSTGVAAKNTNRKFIGIEMDETYFNIAKKRIDEVNENP